MVFEDRKKVLFLIRMVLLLMIVSCLSISVFADSYPQSNDQIGLRAERSGDILTISLVARSHLVFGGLEGSVMHENDVEFLDYDASLFNSMDYYDVTKRFSMSSGRDLTFENGATIWSIRYRIKDGFREDHAYRFDMNFTEAADPDENDYNWGESSLTIVYNGSEEEIVNPVPEPADSSAEESDGSPSSEKPGSPGKPSDSSTPSPSQTVTGTVMVKAADHGDVRTNVTEQTKGNPVTVTVTPDEGYELDRLIVRDGNGKELEVTENGDGTHTFLMPESPKAEVEAFFKEKTVEPEQKPNPQSQPTAEGDLNRTDHIRYMQGYEDGTVRPMGSVTRAETATVLYRLLTADRRNAIFTAENDFSDVSAELWFNKAVSSMTNGGYLKGYEDGSFRGNQKITRAEFAVILSRFDSFKTRKDVIFLDLERSHWAYQAIASGVSQGWVHGYEDATFRPDQPITRAEAVTMINRYLNRGISADSTLGSFTGFSDNDPAAWYYYEIIEATNDHMSEGLRPIENWTANTLALVYDVDRYEKP